MEAELQGLADIELVERARDGEEEAFEVLMSRHYGYIFGYAYRMTSSQADAEDITQETLVKVARSIRNFRGQAKFTTWLYRVTANCTTDWFKRQKRRAEVHEEFTKEEQINSQEGVRDDLSEDILLALSSLNEKERQAIVLTFYEGLTHAEIAKISSCAETTVSWRVFSAKKKLKKYFQRMNSE